ncbi:MAG: HAMP domain-containing histidine kinase [Lachnospiraceae bacterium]|nr:HAMP domain-containing histidine kinase [Lachnospiraceae bacterium]
MRIRTFIATYLLFLAVLFSSVGIVSFYLNKTQINMLKDKCAGQFQTIVSSLDRDVAVTWGRNGLADADFFENVEMLIRGYAKYYLRHNISITMIDYRLSGSEPPPSEIAFYNNDGVYFILISGLLSEPFGYFLLDYRMDITESITEMRMIQNILLISMVAFSVIAAIGLYLVLTSIFRPLAVVAEASREISNGKFDERIPVNAKNELAQVAIDFNKMAEHVEHQIFLFAEEAENKQQFVDNFAHEMRTPLTAIYGYAEYMQKAPLEDGEVVEISERIMNRAGYLKDIANSLLELAMLRDYKPKIKEIQVQHLFDDIAQTLAEPIALAGINFIYNTNAYMIKGQEDLLKSLMLNLCHNAIKACPRNKGIISMEAKEECGGITLAITDDGCGIPKESLAKVTEPFYRVDKARNRKEGGTGLGLTLCKRIAEAHGAEMSIESGINVGTTVKIKYLQLHDNSEII